MPEPANRGLARLVPEPTRSEAFLPARQDLRLAGFSRPRYLFSLAVLLCQCWWIELGPSQPTASAMGDRLMQFVRVFGQAFRILRRQPAFTSAAVLTLALGLGANVAVFSVVEAVFLQPLPYPTSDRLVVLQHQDGRTGLTKPNVAIGDFLDFRRELTTVDHLVAYSPDQFTVLGPGDPVRTDAVVATLGLAESLGVRPALGRLLNADDMRDGAAPVVMLSHALWTKSFGADPGVVGRRVQIGQLEREVVGIVEPGFRFPATSTVDTGLLLPWRMSDTPPSSRTNGWPLVLGRVKEAVSISQVSTELRALAERFEREHPTENAGIRYAALPMRDALLGDARRPLLLLLGAVAFVLVIACANVGNLLLARAVGRRQEMAVRVALGAGRLRLLSQLVAESLVLAMLAVTVGIVGALWGLPALIALVPESVAIPGLLAAGLNARVLGFAIAVAVASAVVFSAITAMTIAVGRNNGALIGQGRVSAAVGTVRLSSLLVVVEVAFAVVLIAGAGLVMQTLGNLLGRDPGFNPDRVLTLNLSLPPSPAYQSVDGRHNFWQRTVEALSEAPGVDAVGLGVVTPLTGNNWTIPFVRTDRPIPSGEKAPDVGWQNASGGFFDALQIPLREGRLFDQRDRPDTAPVVIISESIARRYFPDEPVVGRSVRVGESAAEIVGVVGDIRRANLADEPRLDMYLPFERAPQGSITAFIRTSGDPLASAEAVRRAVRAIDNRVVVSAVSTLSRTLNTSIASTTLTVWLLGLFALIALALAGVGVYGVMSYSAGLRSRELGTRVALGATRDSLVWLMIRQGLASTSLGIVLGLVVTWMAGYALRGVLFGVGAFDPMTITAAVLVIVVATFVACLIPAVRASRVDAARTLAGT
jgi:predicted permease